MATPAKPHSDDDPEVAPNRPSTLDPLTHAEIQMLYRESTETMRFVKNHQWKTVGATLLTYLGLIFIAGYVGHSASVGPKIMGVTIVLCCAVIFTLIIYQFWMHNELTKIDRMQPHFSSAFADIRAAKPRREGNIHRYLLLSFMIVVVILGAIVVRVGLDSLAR